MKPRLASAVIELARDASFTPGGDPALAWLLIDGVDLNLARQLVEHWPAELPPIFVVAPEGADFGDADLRGSSATRHRNQGSMCLVVCEGQLVADGQSVRGFERCGADRLASSDGALRLARQEPDVSDVDGLRAVFDALADPKLDVAPSARAIAAFMDEIAAGASVADALPAIGGFRDTADPNSITASRVLANLNLAASRQSAERLAPSALADIRERAERSAASDPTAAGERVIQLLLARDAAILRELSFDQAVSVLEQPPAEQLRDEVVHDLDSYAARQPDSASEIAAAIPLAADLDDALKRKEAAQRLLELDAGHMGGVLRPQTRRRLRTQRRDRSISEPSLEAGLVRAIEALASPLKRIQLREPQPQEGGSSEAAMKAVVAIAAAHVSLAPILRRLEAAHQAQVSAALLSDPGAHLRGALAQLQDRGGAILRAVKIAVRGAARSDTIEVNWTPGSEELALLVTHSRFASAVPGALWLDSTSPAGTITLSSLAEQNGPAELQSLAGELATTASAILRDGYEPEVLQSWTTRWAVAVEAAGIKQAGANVVEALSLAGCIRGANEIAVTALAPLKSEWLAQRTLAWLELVELAAQTAAGGEPRAQGDSLPPPIVPTARALGAATAARYPGFIAMPGGEAPLLPASDGSVFATFGAGRLGAQVASAPIEPIQTAFRKLLDLHPEAAEYLRCAAWRSSASDLLVRALLEDMRRSTRIGSADVLCIAGGPNPDTLAQLDDFARGQSPRRIQLRYQPDFGDVAVPAELRVHLAVLEGITDDPARGGANIETVTCPEADEDVLFTPRTWVRPDHRPRVLLIPPRLSRAGVAWHRLMTAAIEDDWPVGPAAPLRVPELRTDAVAARPALDALHDRALWVATLDRYATSETIRQAVDRDVAILHQERRAAGDAVYGLVISQRSGGTADRAIARSLRASNLLDETAAEGVASGLRRSAARGYGILALRAATTGSGINELIGHVAAFHRLTSDATPWPLPPGCRVILLSLDEYGSWFPAGRRADLLALALSPEEGGVHAANIEVKAVKNAGGAAREALVEAREQLRKTLVDSRFAAYPNESVFSRLWLNRIVEAAMGVCRENGFRLAAGDLTALDNFRSGEGDLEWAGIAMVFAPGAADPPQHSHVLLMGDRIPIRQVMIPLTAALLADAATSDGTQLRTVATGRPMLASSSKRRRVAPRGGDDRESAVPDRDEQAPVTGASPDDRSAAVEKPDSQGAPTASVQPAPSAVEQGAEPTERRPHPMIGWDAASDEPVEWRVTGADALSNGHVEIYGTSGAGKTQFVMSLLSQLKAMGSHFGVCDFKNDYGGEFPEKTGASFFDLWTESLPFNPLAIEDPSRRNLQALSIELRDAVDIAARAYARLGHRQLTKLQQAFEEGFEQARQSGRPAPTLRDIHELLDDDLKGVIGDLTGTDLFGDGPPLGSLVDHDAVFGLNRIPGTGITTTLAAGFILAALYLKLLEMPQVTNSVRYTVVIDEAHRVAHFHSVGSMVRELRSKGLAVILATQRPGDLPEEASTNAQTKIYLRLPGAPARDAAKALDPGDRELAQLIHTLKDGEALVAFSGGHPRLVRLRQFWRDG